MSGPQPTAERRTLRGGMFEVPVLWAGRGRPVLFLHDAWGLVGGWEPGSPLSRLAEDYLVIAPSHPGVDGATGLEHLDDWLDLALYYLDFVEELKLESPCLIGHGLGGMIAAEMASLEPTRIAKLVLIAPYGLWLEGAPITDIFSLGPSELREALWFHPEAAPSEPDGPEAALRQSQNLAAAAKFIWPIPDKGLRKRLHRLAAPTLLVWGERDGIVPPVYAEAFRQRLAWSQVVTIPGAGHVPQVEQPHAFTRTVLEFLEG